MIKGIYSAASAMIANLARQSALTHNISNVDTPGFKQVLVSLDDFTQVSAYRLNQPNAYLGPLGLGVTAAPEEIDFQQGALQYTGQPLDMAIDGAGLFTIQTEEGVRYTRDGRFLRDAENHLTTVDGYLVLDDNGSPITIPDGSVGVFADGTITVDGVPAGRLGIASFEDPSAALIRESGNVYAAEGEPTGTDPGLVQQGVLEASNVDITAAMTRMVSISRAYEAAQQLVQIQDNLLGRAIDSLGRF